MVRVILLMALATVVWVPVGVWISLRPPSRKVQPSRNSWRPSGECGLSVAVVLISVFLNPDIGLAFSHLRHPMVHSFQCHRWHLAFQTISRRRCRIFVFAAGIVEERDHPRHFPYYVTGALTLRADRGTRRRRGICEMGQRHGGGAWISAYIAKATADGDYPKIVLVSQ
jgi:NitT/TauT family transport system permease protein